MLWSFIKFSELLFFKEMYGDQFGESVLYVNMWAQKG